MNDKEQKKSAAKFVKRWEGKGYKKGEESECVAELMKMHRSLGEKESK